MAPIIRITTAELIDALAAAATGNGPDEAKTANELAEESGIPVKVTRKALLALKQAGRLQIHTVSREALDGRLSRIAGYTITPAKKK